MSERMTHLSERGPKKKRARYDDMNSSSTFEEELALIDTIESESDHSQFSQSQESQDSVQNNLNTNTDFMTNRSKWSRPSPPNLDPSKDNLIFQQLDIDNYVGRLSINYEIFTGFPINCREFKLFIEDLECRLVTSTKNLGA